MGWSTERDGRSRARGEQGAALVEFSLVMVLLFTLLFGMIMFGLILSFKQDVTRAAAEGARAGAVAFPADATYVQAQAVAALDEAIDSFGGSFNGTGCQANPRPGLTCNAVVVDCATKVAVTAGTTQECILVTLEYDYDGFPLYPIPLIGGLVAPDKITATSIARTNA